MGFAVEEILFSAAALHEVVDLRLLLQDDPTHVFRLLNELGRLVLEQLVLFLNLLHILDPRLERFYFHLDVLLRGRVQPLYLDLLKGVHHVLPFAQTANPAFQWFW